MFHYYKGYGLLDKYKKLLSNTLIFAIGMFSSKLLTFFMVPFYTNVLTENELGTAGLVVQAANLLIPVVSCGVANSIIRYGLGAESASEIMVAST